MKGLLFTFTIFLILVSHTIEAETYLQLHTISYHLDRESKFNELNYGVGLRHYVKDEKFNYITIGVYKNSEFNTSVYSGIGWEWGKGDLKFGVSAGIITGYSLSNVLPFLVPNIRYEKFNITMIPYPSPVVHLSVDVFTF